MRSFVTVWIVASTAAALWACSPRLSTVSDPSIHAGSVAPSRQLGGGPSPNVRPTAPPPILYPPHDPAATYPVIRTWTEVLNFHPFPYLKPLPPAQASGLDGVYAKFDPGEPQWWRCARCPDFKLTGGGWRIMLHQGTMLMYYEVTGFSTVASFTVDGNHLELFNDPHCPYETGGYTWSLEDGSLVLTELQDTCAIHLRAENLVHQPWISCQPRNTEAAISDHWIRPKGCG